MKKITSRIVKGGGTRANSWLKRIRPLAGVAMVLILSLTPARGHVLEGAHVLELMAQTLAGAKTLRVEQQVIIEDDAFIEQPPAPSETLSYAFPDRFRSDTRYEGTSRIFVRSSGQTLTVIDNRRGEIGENRFDRYVDLLLYRSRPLLHKMLLSKDVDVEKASLGRFEDRVVYVLGAQYPDESISQVWVDKESLLPLRWINVSATDVEDRIEFIYRDWQKKNNLWYPTRIEIWFHQVLIRRIVTTDWQVDVELPNNLFDISQLMLAFPLEAPTVLPGTTGSDVDEVEHTIEQFQKKFEN